uniref:Uncharacterized protein n=1 Tax=Oryza punctata TaxID=4537 RepID=A0A0E0JHF9_ORYPU
MAALSDALCLAIVAGAIAASLWAMLSSRRRPPATSPSGGSPPYAVDAAAASIGSGASGMWRSRWSGVRPAWLLASRAAAVVALAGVLLWDAMTYDLTIMVYYTEWTFMLEIVYFVIDESIVRLSDSLMEINHGADQKGGAGLNQLGRFMQIVYQVLGGAVVLTDVVFWALIVPFMYSSHFSLNAVMGCIHSFNLVFLLIETTLNSLEFPWFRMTYFVLWTCSYVIIQWVVHVCGLTWWPYPFLNPAAPWAPLWYFCIAVLHLACYTVYWAIGEMRCTKGVTTNSGQ